MIILDGVRTRQKSLALSGFRSKSVGQITPPLAADRS